MDVINKVFRDLCTVKLPKVAVIFFPYFTRFPIGQTTGTSRGRHMNTSAESQLNKQIIIEGLTERL